MSISAHIEFKFAEDLSAKALIETLLKAGWTLDDNGHISYLPHKDEGKYDWQWCGLHELDKVMSIIEMKQKCGETIGLSITWEKTNIGGELLVWESERVFVLNLTCNRKNITGTEVFTDFSWYLSILLPQLSLSGLIPSHIICEHIP